MMVLKKAVSCVGTRCFRRTLPKAPDEWHDRIRARYSKSVFFCGRVISCCGKPTLMLLHRNQLSNGCLEYADVPAYR